METSENPTQTQGHVKESYCPPRLVRFGTVEEITQSELTAGMDRNGGNGRPGS